jgi:transcription termination/antitermination protein NusG
MIGLCAHLCEFSEPSWYAVYTRPRFEHHVASRLANYGIEYFLPQYVSKRQWHDRMTHLSLPLFPSYVFVRISLRDHRPGVHLIPGIVRFVGTRNHPTPLATSEIESLRRVINSFEAAPHPFLNEGSRVRVIAGPLAGVEGIVLSRKHRCRLVLSITTIRSSIAVEVDSATVQPIQSCTPLQAGEESCS